MLNMKVLNYSITSDASSISVSRTKISEETGKEGQVLVGHYPTLELALRGIQRHYTMAEGTNIQSIKDYRKAFQDLHKAFQIELELEENK